MKTSLNLPCPFCGSSDLEFHTFDLNENYHQDTEKCGIKCNYCYAIGPVQIMRIIYNNSELMRKIEDDHEKDAWLKWNSRK